MGIPVIFLVFPIISFGAYANPVQPASEIDSNLKSLDSRHIRASPVEEERGSESLIGLSGNEIESSLIKLHEIVKRSFWGGLGQNVGRGFKKVGSGLWKGVTALGNAVFYNRYGYLPNQTPGQYPPPAPMPVAYAPPEAQAPSESSDYVGSGENVGSQDEYGYS